MSMDNLPYRSGELPHVVLRARLGLLDCSE